MTKLERLLWALVAASVVIGWIITFAMLLDARSAHAVPEQPARATMVIIERAWPPVDWTKASSAIVSREACEKRALEIVEARDMRSAECV